MGEAYSTHLKVAFKILVGKPDGYGPLVRSNGKIIKTNAKVIWCELNLSGFTRNPLGGFFQHSSEHLNFIKGHFLAS
jgi:hypothetical protein